MAKRLTAKEALRRAKAELRQSARVERAKARIAKAKKKAERPTPIRRQRVTRSAPGESPAVQTGTLLGRIIIHTSLEPMVRQIIAKAPHSHLLEFGTKTMKPRPFLRVGLNRNLCEFGKMMRGIIK